MSRMRSIIRYMLIGSMVLTLVGCSKIDEPMRETKEVSTLDWYINYSWFTQKWGEDLVSQKITKETDVAVRFIVPMGKEGNKLDTLMKGDQLPDIITLGWWEPQLNELIKNNRVYALNELNEQYKGDFLEVVHPKVYEWYTQEDGNIYGYPSSYFLPEDYENYNNIASNQTFLVRKDIYEAIGSPNMTTPQGFKDALYKAVEMYPEVNGEPLIPLGAHQFEKEGCVSFDKYLQDFLAIPYEKNGAYYDRYTDPEYIRWLKLFRELRQEGYLRDEIFTDQRIQMEEKIAKGQYFAMIYQRTDLRNQQIKLYNTNPTQVYQAIDGPKNSRGDDHVLPGIGLTGWTVTLISKDCKDPKKALELMSYMMSEEGQLTLKMGVEGETYEWLDGAPVFKPDVQKLLDTDGEKFDRLYGGDFLYWMLQNESMFLKWKQPLKPPLKQLEEWTLPYTTYLEQYTIQLQDTKVLRRMDERINNLWGETLVKLLLAESEEAFDGYLNTFIQERNALGFEQLMKEKTKRMQRNKVKLEMK